LKFEAAPPTASPDPESLKVFFSEVNKMSLRVVCLLLSAGEDVHKSILPFVTQLSPILVGPPKDEVLRIPPALSYNLKSSQVRAKDRGSRSH